MPLLYHKTVYHVIAHLYTMLLHCTYHAARAEQGKIIEMLGEFVPVSHIDTIQPNTQFHYLAGG